jgi:glucose-6-phosphate 1-dehydrogenase
LKLEIHSWRWQGIPIFIRAGKNLPVTCSEVFVKLRQPPLTYSKSKLVSNYLRFRLNPDVTIALGTMVMNGDGPTAGHLQELFASHHPTGDEMGAYERLLGEAMRGDATLFAREDYVEEAWRIVDPVLKSTTPVFSYEKQTWGPPQASRVIAQVGDWHEPQPLPG